MAVCFNFFKRLFPVVWYCMYQLNPFEIQILICFKFTSDPLPGFEFFIFLIKLLAKFVFFPNTS